MTLAARRARDWLPAAVVFLLGIALWEGYTRGADVQAFLLPPPSDILDTLWASRETFERYKTYHLLVYRLTA